jgi:hypothetical protein
MISSIYILRLTFPQEPLSRLPSASALELSVALTSFDAFLSVLDPISSPRLALLRASNPRIATRIHQAALEQVGRVYLTVVEEVRAPKNKYEAPQSLLGSRRPFGQEIVLWQVLGVENSDLSK